MITFKIYPKVLFTALLSIMLFAFQASAQQWSGNNNLNDPIFRNGNVGIGINNPNRPLHLRGSNTVLQIDRDTKDPGFGVTRWAPGFSQVWKSFFFYTEGNGPNDGRFIIADWGQDVSGPSTPRLVIDNDGNIGIGTLTPDEKLEVDGRTKSGNTTIGTWAVSDAYALFGNNDLDQTDTRNYALLHQNNGQTWLNSTNQIRFMINNTSQMTLDGDGELGIGTTNPTEKLHVTQRARFGNTFVGPWAANPSIYAFFGHTSLDHTNAINYALLQQNNGRTLLNSPVDIRFRINNRDEMVIANSGNVGIGTSSPQRIFTVGGGQTPIIGLKSTPTQGELGWALWESSGNFAIYEYTNAAWTSGANRMVVERGGNVGLGVANPTVNLDVAGLMRVGNTGDNSEIRFIANNDIDGAIGFQDDAAFGQGFYVITNNSFRLNILENGNVGIGTTSPTCKLDVNGTTCTDVLTIRGGSDIAEPFEVTTENEETVEAGSIVIINKEETGKVKLSHTAYDKKVIGIVSGANGVNPGMILSQEEVLGGGENIAISGRVYVKANTSNGDIEAGDFLTTSDITGEAMKVTDFDKARGAIIGKAMSTINEKGFVLVFVSLQ